MIFCALPKKEDRDRTNVKMDIKGGCRTWYEKEFHGNQMVSCIFADCWRQQRLHSKDKRATNKILLHVHLDGVRRMSFLTGWLLLFFSRSFASLHDLTFAKTILDAAESFTGSNNITLNTLALHTASQFAINVSYLSFICSIKVFSSLLVQFNVKIFKLTWINLMWLWSIDEHLFATITLQICRMTKVPKKRKKNI